MAPVEKTPRSLQVKPVRIVQERKAYRVPRHQAPTDLMLDGNEGQAPKEDLYKALQKAGIAAASKYPSAKSLEAFLAEKWQAPTSRVLVTAGGDDAIDRISRAILGEGRELIFPTPSFEMMAQYGEIAGGTLCRVIWEPGRPYPLEDVLKAINPNTGIIAVISPNNPTGTTVPFSFIEQLSEAAPHAIILLDLAYVEFADQDPTQEALLLPNVVITRTLSKAWGLAGIRVGYALAHPQVIEWMRIAGEPYAVSGTSLVLAETRLKEAREEVELFIQKVRAERDILEDKLTSFDGQVVPSQANFVFAKMPDAEWIRDGLAGMGIAIRCFPGNPQLQNRLRITCPGNEEQFSRLEHALDTTLAPEAIIFDMDGVLVDVSESYREAIIQTAQHFGEIVTKEEITEAKAQGNANNDWMLTQQILANRGKEFSLQEVTKIFEELYQGAPNQKGLRFRETLLVSTAWLKALASKYPLAIVTGRPKQDAHNLLQRFELVDLFGSIVCMEDETPKPSPDPVFLALKQLGVKRAWMLGDTPDDLRAARGAAVLPIGVLAPGEDAETMQLPLARSGAARLLQATTELEQCLRATAQTS